MYVQILKLDDLCACTDYIWKCNQLLACCSEPTMEGYILQAIGIQYTEKVHPIESLKNSKAVTINRTYIILLTKIVIFWTKQSRFKTMTRGSPKQLGKKDPTMAKDLDRQSYYMRNKWGKQIQKAGGKQTDAKKG